MSAIAFEREPKRIHLRFLVAVLACLLPAASCGAKSGPVERYSLTGKILRLDTANHTATIQHGPIRNASKVWMEAMTMEFPVNNPEEFAKLRTGETINATVNVRPSDGEYWIADIRETTPAAQ